MTGQGAVQRARAALRTLRRWEIVALVAGMLTVVAALSPPLDRLADERLSAHMVQHELLVLIAAPLLVLGRPLAVCLAALPPGLRGGVSRSARAADAGALVAWLAHAVAIWVWHAPAPYDLAVRVPVLHALEHASLLGTAVLFWWALLHRPKAHAHLGAAAVYVFTTALHTGLLGVLLLLARQPWYAHLISSPTTDPTDSAVPQWMQRSRNAWGVPRLSRQTTSDSPRSSVRCGADVTSREYATPCQHARSFSIREVVTLFLRRCRVVYRRQYRGQTRWRET